MQSSRTHRRALLCASAGALCAALFTIAGPLAAAPVTINIVDVAGNLALTQDAIEAYQKKHPDLISKINFTKAPAPELPGKLKAMQGAGRSDIDMVLTGTDFLAAGIEQGVLIKVLPEYAGKLPNLMANYQPAAAKMQELAHDYGVAVIVHAGGSAGRVQPGQGQAGADDAGGIAGVVQGQPEPPDLRPAGQLGPRPHLHHGSALHSRRQEPQGPGERMGKDVGLPQRPQFSASSITRPALGATMKEFGEGSRDITLTMTGWDINPRALGIVPKTYKVAPFKGMTWVNDAHYMVIPKGVPPEKVRGHRRS